LSNINGNILNISIFGQSHGKAVGVVINGLPAGETIDMDKLQTFLNRRAPGRSTLTTARREEDVPVFLSGLVGNTTCGSPLCAIIENADARSQDYEELRDKPRPSHADYAAYAKYGIHHDIRGGGHFSGRLTAPLCIAGGILLQMLERRNVTIGSHIASIAGIEDAPFHPVNVDRAQLEGLGRKTLPVIDDEAGARMKEQIERAKAEGDSVGGVVEACALGVPAGTGLPMFDGMENRIAQVMFGIPAVKGVAFGAGFAAASMRGSQHNDAFCFAGDGTVKTRTNAHGGCLGGIASGMPILVKAAFKPTPSIAMEQETVSLGKGTGAALRIQGRHDPCIVLRAVPCVEAAMSIAIADLMLARAAEQAF
jgi:chorismate synthase